MGVRMRVNRSHTGNRRSHHALEEPRLSKCECGAFHKRHRACSECGKYRGKQVIDIVARVEKQQRRAKRKQEEAREMGQEANTPTEETKTTKETKGKEETK
ncbi:50S ribosomal protein L32 [Candidatus Kaiserbacteria bacterium CG10_big_fil_rev_8_21_14_0_10_43_70]|uniref:Large ribosomal subunit protein bL32 n=1 Tax=Candidatus Kaiserbacteria bacterium CG10_big_fil_rev_8_21_14_0_10_43_70 TaxID=1974605 RepID=A0A2H0UIZ6_9BACT|nr:MAG: 50S ribosomal protein L32 [Candidatus Kaiserbacteria bacterium CG10_big_fil_rev_8_21_14_0_10_43_70]